MWMRWMLGAWVGCLALSCSSSHELSGSVAGKWCGSDVATPAECVGDEVEYLDLTQSGSSVDGKICEAYEKDCAPLQNGKLEGKRLSFEWNPVNIGGKADLELDGDLLAGSLHADKCGCEVAYTFHRL